MVIETVRGNIVDVEGRADGRVVAVKVLLVEVVEGGGGGTSIQDIKLGHVAVDSIEATKAANSTMFNHTMCEVFLAKFHIVPEQGVEVVRLGLVAFYRAGAVSMHSVLAWHTEVPIASHDHAIFMR